jgi:hypothetical protein
VRHMSSINSDIVPFVVGSALHRFGHADEITGPASYLRGMEGSEHRRVWVRGSRAEIQFAGPVTDVRLDPDEMFLLRR